MYAVKTMINVCFLLASIFLLSSCAAVFNNSVTGETGTVQLFFEPLNTTLADNEPAFSVNAGQANHRTFFPGSSNGRYEIKFTNTDTVAGKIVTATATGNHGQDLDVGTWTLDVIRYEGSVPVARGSDSINITSGDDIEKEVKLDPIPGGTGVFSYTIKSNIAKSLSKANISVHSITDGDSYSYNWTGISSGEQSLSKTVNLPTGYYDVNVTFTHPDGMVIIKNSVARIYSGLTTETGPDFFGFADKHFANKIYIAVAADDNKIASGVTPDSFRISAFNTADDSPLFTSPLPVAWTTGAEEIVSIDPGVSSVYFVVEITDGNVTYTDNLKGFPQNIDGKNLETVIYPRIYNITGSCSDNGNSISVSMGGTRTAASPGEKITLTIGANFGLNLAVHQSKGGNVSYNGSDNTYTFIMPDDDVNLDAVFLTGDLESLSISSSEYGGVVSSLTSSGIDEYTADINSFVTKLNVSAVSSENAVINVSGQGLYVDADNKVTGFTTDNDNIIIITVTPPAGSLCPEPRTYKITVTITEDEVA